MASAEATTARPGRLALIDAARGVAIVAMVGYHFSWDLTSFGYADFNLFGDPWWLAFRAVILSSFLFITGLSQQLGHAGGVRLRRDCIRFAKIAAGALAITLATWWVFPENYIFFGVLHHIAVASLVLSALHRLPAAAFLVLAAVAASLPHVVPPSGLLDAPALLWLGLASYEPFSNDFVAVFPWLALVLAGAACAPAIRCPPKALAGLLHWQGEGAGWRWLRVMGRHSLAIYLLHQPLLWGGLWLWAQLESL